MLVVAFSLGLAVTLTGVGLLVLYARRFIDRVPSSRPLFRLLPVVSAALVTALGAVLTLRGLDTFPSGAPLALRAALAAGAVLLVASLLGPSWPAGGQASTTTAIITTTTPTTIITTTTCMATTTPTPS